MYIGKDETQPNMNKASCLHKLLSVVPQGISNATRVVFKCRYASPFLLIRQWFCLASMPVEVYLNSLAPEKGGIHSKLYLQLYFHYYEYTHIDAALQHFSGNITNDVSTWQWSGAIMQQATTWTNFDMTHVAE